MIVFVDQSGQIGGAELCLADIATRYRDRCRVVLLADGPFATLLEQRGIPCVVCPMGDELAGATKTATLQDLGRRIPPLIGILWRLRKELRSADVVYLNTAKALLLGLTANMLPRRPVVFHLHDLWTREHFSASNLRTLVAAANRTDAVIANSRATANAFAKNGGRTPVHVIPNGFDPGPFDAVSPDRIAALRAEWNPDGMMVAAMFGRISRWKGQDQLLRAAERHPELMVWIVGDALYTGDDAAYAEELRRLAAPFGSRVRFMGFRSDIAALMRAADIVVHASVAAEPFGRVIVEAMLAGKPVIAANAGGPAEILTDGETGFLTPPGDGESLGQALARLTASETLRGEIGVRARAAAEQRYLLASVLDQIEEVIEAVERK